ncbi:nucleotidyltransferase family protein, partial [Azospirillum sp. B4]|uniref:nucleotidyltransferase family protein n=1 Tax=Azospirillum sp. B4 TaxID=95605 RepID=UPI0005CAE85F
MITDPDLLYNRHRLSAFQIRRHFGWSGPLQANAQAMAEDHFQTLDAFFQLADALAAHQIPFIPLKGPVLSDLIYGDATARRFYDLDFLVDPRDIGRAVAVAAAHGYIPQETVPADAQGWERLFAGDHHFLCRHADSGTDVELHWRLFAHYDFPGKTFADLYRDDTIPYCKAGPFSQTKRSYRTLNHEMEFVFILAHGSKHVWFRLKWLVDVNDYLRTVPLDLDTVRR